LIFQQYRAHLSAIPGASARRGANGWAAMDIWRTVKRQARALIAPVVFLSLTAYFGWHASQGERGLVAYGERQKDLVLARAQLARAEGEVVLWERRVAGLRGSRLDADALDERARAMLNASEPNDIVLMYANGQKPF
jgi:cell division protein FtsB